MNNILRIGKVNVIGDVILFLGRLCVSLFCALFAFLMLDTHKYKSAHNKISSPLFPVLVSSHFIFKSAITCLFNISSYRIDIYNFISYMKSKNLNSNSNFGEVYQKQYYVKY